MAGLIHVMRSTNFNCENTAELLTQAEQTEQAQQEETNDPLGMTPLLQAATLGLLSELKDLLAAGGDANTRYGIDEVSLLDAATLMGHPEVVRALLKHGVDVNHATSSPGGYTALQRAVDYGRADLLAGVIDLLLSAGADIDAPTDEGFTPLHLASARPDCGDVTAILLRYGATKDPPGHGDWSPLHMAAMHGNVAATRALLAAGANIYPRYEVYNESTKAALDIAAHSGQVEIIRELVRHGVDLDDCCDVSNWTALDHAVRENHAGAVDALIEAGATVNTTVLRGATESLALGIMTTLLRHGAPIKAADGGGPYRYHNQPLHIAARLGGTEGAAEAVELLLRWGADESERCYDGNTPSEVVGVDVGADVVLTPRLVADADRVRGLLAKAPAERAWRRRRLLILCLARNRTTTMKRRKIGCGGGRKGQGKGRGAEEGGLAWHGCGGGGGDDTVPSAGASVAVAAGGKRQITSSRAGGGSGSGGSRGCSGGDLENGVDFDDVAAMLLQFEQEGFFRTIVGFL